MPLNCEVMVLCAGLGTRLRPLTLEVAKPAVPLFGRPLAGYPLALAQAAGFTRACINTHWLPDTMRAAAEAEATRLGLGLAVSHEPQLLGTGGGLWQVRERGLVPRDRAILVLNGDVLFDVDVARVVAEHERSGAAATLVLRAMPPDAPYTPLEVDETGRVVRIGRWGQKTGRPGHLFTGVHVLSPAALDLLPPGESGVMEAVYAKLLATGAHVHAVFEQGTWLDLGDPGGYLEAHLALLDGTLPLGPLATHVLTAAPLVAVQPTAEIDPSARVTRSVVGARVKIGAGAHVTDCVLWDGVEVAAGEVLQRTIVTPNYRTPVR